MTTNDHQCGQESRLAVMESVLDGINKNLSELKDLMVTVIQAQERIAALRQGHTDQEKRIWKLEHSQAAGKWTERVIWLLVSTGLVGFFKFFGGGEK